YYTLPRHWLLAREVQSATPGANVLEDGRFETGDQCRWKARQTSIDDMVMVAQLVDREFKEGTHSLLLAVEPKRTPAGVMLPAPPVLERTFLAVDSPQVQLPPGTLVRVSAWIKMPDVARGTADGALFYDSAGGESLAVRINELTKG